MLKKLFYTIAILTLMSSNALLAQQQGRVEITATDTLYHDIQSNANEIEILKELFESTGGKRWKSNKNWLKNNDFSSWFGIVTEYGDVVEIHLDNNNLKGTIPKSVYKLIRLRYISFDGNNLSEAKATNTFSKSAATTTAGFSQLSEASEDAYGKNLPVWGLAVNGSIQKLDWRNQPPVAENLVAQPTQVPAASGVGIDDCGRLAFYVLHTGVDALNQLNIYATDGTKLTTSTTALSSVQGNNELQVVRVPGKSDEWYVIYSLWYTSNCGNNTQFSIYCPAQVVYTRIKYDATTKTLTFIPNQREVRIGSTLTDTYIQGKAVSRTVDNDPTRHYLYLAARTTASVVTRIHRFIIDANGITFQSANNQNINVGWWLGTIAGSTIELSPDEKTLAINNRNAQQNVLEDIILFDITNFNSTTYQPVTISVPDMRLQDMPDKTLREVYTTMPQYTCLKNLKYKLNGIQFSPSGQYLYVTHGGYPLNTGGLTYNTYLLQIDLTSATNPERNNFIFRTQIQLGLNFLSPRCTGTTINASDHAMGQIESAFDGRIYFTKASSNTLFVIPKPNDPMPHSLEAGALDLSNASAPNIDVLGGTGAYVTFMPENIDGFDYLKESSVVNFNLEPESISIGGSTSLTILSFNSANTYQISWGDGVVETVTSATKSHVYNLIGEYAVKLTLTTPSGCTTLTSKTVTVGSCTISTAISIQDITYFCAVKFSSQKLSDCLVDYSWNFGDGATSLERNPIHAYASPGTYNVSLTVNYDCPGCRGTKTVNKSIIFTPPATVIENEIIQILTDQKLEVLSTSASSFSDAWPLSHPNNTLDNRSSYVNGSQGVWRNNASFVYEQERKLSPATNIATDGTFTLEQFNWKHAELNAVPNWIRANSMTRYSPYSFELENKDVLGVYSGAIYDYGGQLPAANGVNMRQDEMAFTSFEYLDGTVAGNWILGSGSLPAYTFYDITMGNKNVAIVKASLTQLENVVAVAIMSTNIQLPIVIVINYVKTEIICAKVHPQNPAWSIVVLKDAPSEGLWYGQLQIKNAVTPTVTSIFDNTLAHTGKSSLKITADKIFKQELLHLDAGKSYWINGWVSVNNAAVATPVLAANVGIDIIAKQKNGLVISTFSFQPAGTVIEGWQQIKGSFIYPANAAYIEIKFKPGSTGISWYDDLRLHPENGNMKGYVYNLNDYRLQAVLDEENFASYFYYDREGNLHLTKKETTDGIKTLSENISYQVER